MQTVIKEVYESKNEWLLIHKDDDGCIDRPVIKTNDKGIEFSYESAMRFMKKHKLANDGMKSGWFITTRFALPRAKWAI